MHMFVVETRRLVPDAGLLADPDPEIHAKAVEAAEGEEVSYLEAYAMAAFAGVGLDVVAYQDAVGVRVYVERDDRQRHVMDCLGVSHVNAAVLRIGVERGLIVPH